MAVETQKKGEPADAMQLQFIRDDSEVPTDRVSAVFMIAFEGDHILAIQNERGWDIPGGYLEAGESVEEALRRELVEEGGANVARQKSFALLGKVNAKKVMLLYAGLGITLGEFVTKPDAFGRGLMEIEQFIGRYHGDRELLRRLIETARVRIEGRVLDQLTS